MSRRPRPGRRPSASVGLPGCSAVHFGGSGRPQRLIVATLPLQGGVRSEALQLSQAIDLVLEQRQFRAGPFTVGYQLCDDSTATSGVSDGDRCAANGRAFARTRAVVGVIGPMLSSCAAILLPVVNRASDGALAVISPSATYVGLTRRGDGVAPGDPERYYPTGTRNFTRVTATDDAQGAANVLEAQRLGVRSVFVLDDGSLYGKGIAAAFRRTAASRGLAIAGRRSWDAEASGYVRLAGAIDRTGADAVYLAGLLFANGGRLVKDLRARLGADAQLIAPDGFGPPSAVIQRAGAAAEGMTISKPDIPREALGPSGRRFHDALPNRTGKAPCCRSMEGAQAAEVMLDALAASDGTRASVTAAMRRAGCATGCSARSRSTRPVT